MPHKPPSSSTAVVIKPSKGSLTNTKDTAYRSNNACDSFNFCPDGLQGYRVSSVVGKAMLTFQGAEAISQSLQWNRRGLHSNARSFCWPSLAAEQGESHYVQQQKIKAFERMKWRSLELEQQAARRGTWA